MKIDQLVVILSEYAELDTEVQQIVQDAVADKSLDGYDDEGQLTAGKEFLESSCDLDELETEDAILALDRRIDDINEGDDDDLLEDDEETDDETEGDNGTEPEAQTEPTPA